MNLFYCRWPRNTTYLWLQLCEFSSNKSWDLKNPDNENLPVKVLYCFCFYSLAIFYLILTVLCIFGIWRQAYIVESYIHLLVNIWLHFYILNKTASSWAHFFLFFAVELWIIYLPLIFVWIWSQPVTDVSLIMYFKFKLILTCNWCWHIKFIIFSSVQTSSSLKIFLKEWF